MFLADQVIVMTLILLTQDTTTALPLRPPLKNVYVGKKRKNRSDAETTNAPMEIIKEQKPLLSSWLKPRRRRTFRISMFPLLCLNQHLHYSRSLRPKLKLSPQCRFRTITTRVSPTATLFGGTKLQHMNNRVYYVF